MLFISALCRQLTKKKNPLEDPGKATLAPTSEAYRVAEVRVVSIATRCRE